VDLLLRDRGPMVFSKLIAKWPIAERIRSLLTISFRLMQKWKELLPQILLLLYLCLWYVGCRRLGSTYG